jgi:hypothetical protein
MSIKSRTCPLEDPDSQIMISLLYSKWYGYPTFWQSSVSCRVAYVTVTNILDRNCMGILYALCYTRSPATFGQNLQHNLPKTCPCSGFLMVHEYLASPGTSPPEGYTPPTTSPVEERSHSCHRQNDRTICWQTKTTVFNQKHRQPLKIQIFIHAIFIARQMYNLITLIVYFYQQMHQDKIVTIFFIKRMPQ